MSMTAKSDFDIRDVRQIKPGYKKTPVGIIPEDWEVKKLFTQVNVDKKNINSDFKGEYINYVSLSDIENGKIFPNRIKFKSAPSRAKRITQKGDVLFATVRPNLKNFAIVDRPDIIASTGFAVLGFKKMELEFLYNFLFSHYAEKQYYSLTVGSNYPALNSNDVKSLKLPVPPIQEQKSIANCLSTWDSGIEKLTQLIQAKKLRKKGLMQQLLTGKKRLAGFDGKWKEVRLGEIAYCLDNLRVPLNSEERDKMKGEIPYCGANGVIDYVNDFVIDDDIILMAEDGGYFDEYETRPIAYRMKGKCWVNNHAHILKAKENFNHSFLFYSLVHKNVIPYISGGTRAKLNKKHLLQIKINAPVDSEEQTAIANILQTADREIEILEQKLSSLQEQKKGLMQVLLTGEKRLVDYK